jgi:hypothetical protein
MKSADQKVWDESVAYLKKVDSLGFAKVQEKLAFLTNDQQKQEFVGYVKLADSLPAASDPTWKTAARAWMMYKVAKECIQGYLTALEEGEKIQFLNEIRSLGEPGIRSKLESVLSGRAAVEAIVKAQSSPQRNTWDVGGFTNPPQHDPTSFRYIIHSMIPSIEYSDQEKVEYVRAQGRGAFLSGGELRTAELYFTQTSILKTEVMCCSIIDQEKTTTYRGATFGFTMRVPKQNMVAAFDGDASSSPKIGKARGDALTKIEQRGGKVALIDEFLGYVADFYQADLQTPDEILAASKRKEGHNELVVMGETPGSPTLPNGIFVKTSKVGRKVSKEFLALDRQWNLKKLMTGCASRLTIPIIDIPDDKVEASEVDWGTWKWGGLMG